MNNIAAVVVTYNRKNYLKLCLDSLLIQGDLLSSIIIVNNNSTDGTEEMLLNEYLDNPIFDYINIGSNIGGAGGFNYGMKRAYENFFKWIWLMDDDVAPAEGALKKYFKITEKSLFIQGRRAYDDGEYVDWLCDYNYKTGKLIKLSENEYFANKSFLTVNTACFEGAFISREIISSIGFPKKEFFIQGDDTLYGVLASKNHKIIYTKEVLMRKTLRKQTVKYFNRHIEISTPFSIYYLVRNLFIIEKLLIESLPGEKINHSGTITVSIIKIIFKILFIFPDKSRSMISCFKGIYNGLRA